MTSAPQVEDPGNLATDAFFARIWTDNARANAPRVAHDAGFRGLLNRPRNAGARIVVAGSGPSLDAAIAPLRTHRRAFRLICADSALAPLLDGGVTPDLVVSMDAQRDVADFFTGLPTARIGLVAAVVVHPEALDAFRGPIHFVAPVGGSTVLAEIASAFPQLQQLPGKGNCGSQAAFVACIMGFGSVGLVGLDFSYTGDRYYATGVRHPNAAALATRAAIEGRLGDQALVRRNSAGVDVLTDPVLVRYAAAFDHDFGDSARFDIRLLGPSILTSFRSLDVSEFAGLPSPPEGKHA